MKTLIALVVLLSSVAFAAPKKKEPTWWCFKAVDKNGQTVEACERQATICEFDIDTQELSHDTVHCVPAYTAYVFTIKHRTDGTVETLAVPELGACQFLSENIVNEDISLIGKCKLTP